MKKALVLSLAILLGLGLFASAQVLSGEWYSEITIDPTALTIADFFDYYSTLTVNYTVGGWTFTSYSELDDTGWSDQTFSAGGALGAFSFSSLVDFDPAIPAFESWNVTAGLALGGINFGADWTLADSDLTLIFTGDGSTGIVDIDITATFGGDDNNICDLPWQDILIGVDFPFCCADVAADIYFTCAGFDYVEFYVGGIVLPNLPWLTLNATLNFTMQTKSLALGADIDFGADVCFDIYYDVDVNDNLVIGDITFNGIGLVCEIGGVSFTAISYWGTGTKPGLLAGTDYWEAYQIATTDDSCCGPLDFDLTVYFLDGGVALFDIAEFDANILYAMSNNFTFGMGLEYVVDTGLTLWTISFDVTW